MDMKAEAAIVAQEHKDDKMKFKESCNGLHFCDAKTNNQKTGNCTFAHSVAENKLSCIRQQLACADLAKRACELARRPSHAATFLNMIRENQLRIFRPLSDRGWFSCSFVSILWVLISCV